MSIGDDDMVEEVDAHQFTGSLDVFCQFVVIPAGREIARRVVMTDGENRAVGEDGFLHDDTDINSGLCDAAM